MGVDQMVVALMAHLTIHEANKRWTRCQHLFWQEQSTALRQIWTFEGLHCDYAPDIVNIKMRLFLCCHMKCAARLLDAQYLWGLN